MAGNLNKQQNPDDQKAWFNKGVALDALGRHEDALQAYDKATELSPKDKKAWINKGAALSELLRNEEALEAFNKAIDLDPASKMALNNKGRVLTLLGRDEEAEKSFQKAMELKVKKSEFGDKHFIKKVQKMAGNLIKKKQKGVFVYIKHPQAVQTLDKGIVVRFENMKSLKSFLNTEGAYYDPYLERLDNKDKKVTSVVQNGAYLKYHSQQQFDARLKAALKNYPVLNPEKNHLAIISKRNWTDPVVYSFEKKCFRDHFVKKLRSADKLNIFAAKLHNFNGVAVAFAATGKIRSGSLKDHVEHLSEFIRKEKLSSNPKSMVTYRKPTGQREFEDALKLGKRDLRNLDFKEVDFETINFNQYDLNSRDFSGCDFSGKNLDGIKLDGIIAKDAKFQNCSLNGTSFIHADLNESNFKSVRAPQQPATFHGANLAQAGFKYSDIPDAELKNSNLSGSDFYKSNLKGADLNGAILDKANFTGVNLKGADIDLESTRHLPNFKGANLKGTRLENTQHHQPQTQQSAMQM